MPGPRVLDAAALVAEVADELVVRTVRDTHLAWAERVPAAVRWPTYAVASGVYAGIGAGLRATSWALGRLAERDVGPDLEATTYGPAVAAVANGLVGDRLARTRPRLAVTAAVRREGRDVSLDPESLATAFPGATDHLVLLVHGWSESESAFERHRDRDGSTYADTLAELGWTPVLIRANSGLSVRENGVALAALIAALDQAWPVEVERIALIGHSMGGLMIRAACGVATDVQRPWTDRVRDIVTLGTPHLGSPLAGAVGASARVLARVPESAAFGRVLDQRSVGVLDLVHGLGEELPALPHVRYHLVSATLSRSERHPVGWALGDLMVRQPSAYGVSRAQPGLFPDADRLHLPSCGHLDLLNHPRVHEALRDWLGN